MNWNLEHEQATWNPEPGTARDQFCVASADISATGSTLISPRRTALSDDVTACDGCAGCDIDPRQVSKQREDAEAVVDDDGVPGEIQVARDHDTAAVGSLDRCSRRRAKVRALMAARGLAVGDRQSPEAAGCRARNRRIEWPMPIAFRCDNCEGIGHRLGFLFDPRELLLRRIRQLRVDFNPASF